jgi:hypothetical protein
MPQIWLTFEKIADLFYCDTAGARRRVIANQWERRRRSEASVGTQGSIRPGRFTAGLVRHNMPGKWQGDDGPASAGHPWFHWRWSRAVPP